MPVRTTTMTDRNFAQLPMFFRPHFTDAGNQRNRDQNDGRRRGGVQIDDADKVVVEGEDSCAEVNRVESHKARRRSFRRRSRTLPHKCRTGFSPGADGGQRCKATPAGPPLPWRKAWQTRNPALRRCLPPMATELPIIRSMIMDDILEPGTFLLSIGCSYFFL